MNRRLAQNREAARKSRQRRKAYVQNLEEEVSSCSFPQSARQQFQYAEHICIAACIQRALQVDFNILKYSALSRAPCVGAQCQGADLSHSDPHTRDVITCHCNVQVRSLRATKSAGQPLGSGNSSSLGTGSYGIAATTLGLGADANGLLNAIINRLPPGSLSSETSHGEDSAPQFPLRDIFLQPGSYCPPIATLLQGGEIQCE